MRPTLDAREVADLVGRTPVWLYRHWQRLRTEEGFPPPICGDRELVWSRHHIEAWLDRGLEPKQRRIVQTLRLAEAALSSMAVSAEAADTVWRDRLAEKPLPLEAFSAERMP